MNNNNKTTHDQATTATQFKYGRRDKVVDSAGTVEEKEHQGYLASQYRNFYGRGENKYAFYPSYWAEQWGRPPLLGIVFADNEFLAERLAYDRGILPSPCNCTFQAKIKNLGAVKSYGQQSTARS